MKKIICLALMAVLFIGVNSCHDDEIRQNENLALKSGDIKKKNTVDDVKPWFENNPDLNTFELLKWTGEIKWSKALVMEINDSIVVEVPIKLKEKYKVIAVNDPKLNVEHRLLFIEYKGALTSYMEYFVSKNDIGYLYDTEKVNFSKKEGNFDGMIVLENSKKEIRVIYHSESVEECGEVKLKSIAPVKCVGLYENFSDGSSVLVMILYCTITEQNENGGGGSTTITPTPTQPCNCPDVCPVCSKCLDIKLKSVPIPGDGTTTTTTTDPCVYCACPPVPAPIVDATSLEQNPKADCIYKKLINGGILSSFISRYFGITGSSQSYLGELNLTWTLGSSTETLPIGVPRNGTYFSVEIRLNENALNSNSSSDAALSMLHEALHAKLIAEYYDSAGTTDFKRLFAYYRGWGTAALDTNQETEMLNTYSNDMASALQSFDQSLGIFHSLAFYTEAVKCDLANNIFYAGYYQSGIDELAELRNSSINCN